MNFQIGKSINMNTKIAQIKTVFINKKSMLNSKSIPINGEKIKRIPEMFGALCGLKIWLHMK